MSNTNQKIELERLLADYPVLSKQFASADSTLRKTLFREVDESSFALSDWVGSLAVLQEWLNEQGLSLAPKNSLEYISCAAKSVSNSATLTHLPSLVEDFLKQYGCERAVKIQD
jgi:hypothetical protein